VMAVFLNHVRESHFALTDVPVTLLTTGVLVLSLRARETGRLRSFVLAGACAGLAAATKYNGGVALVMPVLAAVLTRGVRPSRAVCAVAAVAAAGGAFLLAAPYTLLDLPAFLNAFAYVAVAYRPRPFAEGAQIYLGHLNVALGWPGLVAAATGLVWTTIRAARNRDFTSWALLAVFPLVYFHLVATKYLIYARYLLPIQPFLAIFVAIALAGAGGWLIRQRQPQWIRAAGMSAIAALVLFKPVRAGIDWPRQYGRPTTSDLAYEMIRQFIPEQSGVAIERSVLRLPDSGYRVVNLHNLIERSREEYLASGVSYLVASSAAFGRVFEHPGDDPVRHTAYRRLLEESAQCLPAIKPSARVSGPEIRICRLMADE